MKKKNSISGCFYLGVVHSNILVKPFSSPEFFPFIYEENRNDSVLERKCGLRDKFRLMGEILTKGAEPFDSR